MQRHFLGKWNPCPKALGCKSSWMTHRKLGEKAAAAEDDDEEDLAASDAMVRPTTKDDAKIRATWDERIAITNISGGCQIVEHFEEHANQLLLFGSYGSKMMATLECLPAENGHLHRLRSQLANVINPKLSLQQQLESG